MGGALKEKKMIFENWKQMTYTHDTAMIKNCQVHHWSLQIKIYIIYF